MNVRSLLALTVALTLAAPTASAEDLGEEHFCTVVAADYDGGSLLLENQCSDGSQFSTYQDMSAVYWWSSAVGTGTGPVPPGEGLGEVHQNAGATRPGENQQLWPLVPFGVAACLYNHHLTISHLARSCGGDGVASMSLGVCGYGSSVRCKSR